MNRLTKNLSKKTSATTILSLLAMSILTFVAPSVAFGTTYYGGSFTISPHSVASGSSVTMLLTTGNGTTPSAPPPGGTTPCNASEPWTCTFLPYACTAFNYYQINQAKVVDPNGNTFMLGSGTRPGLDNFYVPRYMSQGYAPAINVSQTDSGSIPFGTAVGGFYALTSNLPNPPNNVNPEGKFYWWTIGSTNAYGDGKRLDLNPSIVPTTVVGTYEYDLEGLVFCGGNHFFFDAPMFFNVTQVYRPTLATTATPSHITLPSNQTVVDTATVSGGSPSLAGTLNFSLFFGNSCVGTPVYTKNLVPLVSGSASSGPAIPSGGWEVGNYTWQVSFKATDPSDTSIAPQCGGNGEVVTVTAPQSLATRTPGYWATHFNFTQYIFTHQLGGSMHVGPCLTINDMDDLMGGFWANIAKTSTGVDRSLVPGANYGTNLDQMRMQLAQQLIAAILNNAADGSTPANITLAQAGIDFCSGNVAKLNADITILDAFNNSGDTIAFPPGTPGLSLQNISIGGKAAKALSDFAFWNILPGDTGYPISTDSGWS